LFCFAPAVAGGGKTAVLISVASNQFFATIFFNSAVIEELFPKRPARLPRLGMSPEVPGGVPGGVEVVPLPDPVPGCEPEPPEGGFPETLTDEPLPRLVPGGPMTTPGSSGSG